MNGHEVTIVWMPYNWGFKGLSTGASAQTISPLTQSIQCRDLVEKRRPACVNVIGCAPAGNEIP